MSDSSHHVAPASARAVKSTPSGFGLSHAGTGVYIGLCEGEVHQPAGAAE